MRYKRFLENFVALFGEPIEAKETLTGGFWAAWESNKVKLQTQYLRNDKTFIIEFKSKDIEKMIMIKNF